MHLSEQYKTYQIAYDLVKNEGYHVLHMNDHNHEVWLEKYEKRKSKVIRILPQGFDWKNHLKRDIAQVFQQTNAMKQLLVGKAIEIYNIYISSHTPIDEWEMLKRPLQLKEKNSLTMKIYYITESNLDEELPRLDTDLGTYMNINIEEQPETEKEAIVNLYKHRLSDLLYKKNEKVKGLFSFGKPFFTYLLVIVNVIMFVILELNGGSTDIENLISSGAKYNPAMIEGEWWRLISSMFLHIGLLHLFMNMLALYYLGLTVERIYGSGRFLFIYFLAGIAGSLTSFAFSINVSAGASGAIFGLFGALLFFGIIHKKVFFQTMGRNIITIVAINIVLGLVVPQIDMGAHLGGLIAGFIASAIVGLPKTKKVIIQFLAFFAYILLLAALLVFGMSSGTNNVITELIKIEEHMKEKDYEAVVTRVTDSLEHPGDFEVELLFQRSIAYVELNEVELAIEDLEESLVIKTDYPEVYYNLALLYHANGQLKNAQEAVEKAYELNPDDADYQMLYEKYLENKD